MCNTVALAADCGLQVDRWYAQSQIFERQSEAVPDMSNYNHYVRTYRGKDWVFDLKLRQWILREVASSCPIDEVERPGVVRISIGMGTTFGHVRKLYRFLLSWVQGGLEVVCFYDHRGSLRQSVKGDSVGKKSQIHNLGTSCSSSNAFPRLIPLKIPKYAACEPS